MPPPVTLPFSPTLATDGLLFLSGQTAMRDGQLINDSFAAEVNQVMTNIQQLLSQHQLTLTAIVSVTVYLTDMGQFDQFNRLYQSYFRARFPTRTCIAVAALPMGASVELTAIASLAPIPGLD